MFTEEQLREAFCIIAMEILHHQKQELTTRKVMAHIHAIALSGEYGTFLNLHLPHILEHSAHIRDQRNIAPTVQRLLTQLDDPHTLIL